MDCENKNHLLDLYFHEGKEDEHSQMKEHIAECDDCRENLDLLDKTMKMLSKLEDEEPSKDLFDNILSEVSLSVPKPAKKRTGIEIIPILQIACGEIFLFTLIYFIKIRLTSMPFWNALEKCWIVQSIGSAGVSVIVVLIVGSFITLSLAPVLLWESNKRNSFN
jgi:hypothetical protein